MREKRERQVAVRDRPAERVAARPLGIDVNPLVVFRRIGKEVNAVLRGLERLAGAELLPDPLLEFVDREANP